MTHFTKTEKNRERTRNALAGSSLSWGRTITPPRRGCIAVFGREKTFDHLDFYLEENETHIKMLGGHRQNLETKIFEVGEKHDLMSELLGYRIPK